MVSAYGDEPYGDFYEPDAWADPNIRLIYEAALGAFVVEFNALDHMVTTLVGWAFQTINRPLPKAIPNFYAAKVDLLDTLGGMKVLQLDQAPIAELREVGRMRNFLAHGLFDQDPFGSYVIRKIASTQERHVKAEAIYEWTKRARACRDKLELSKAAFWFGKESI